MIEIYHHKYYRTRMGNKIRRIESIVRDEMRTKAEDERQRQIQRGLDKLRSSQIPQNTQLSVLL